MAGIDDNVENLRVNRDDFMQALEEVHPAFGVNEEELQAVVQNGIIHYDPVVDVSVPYYDSSYPLLIFHNRNSCMTANSSWSKCGRLPELHWYLFFFMDRQALGRQRWLLLSLKHLNSPSLSSYLRSL